MVSVVSGTVCHVKPLEIHADSSPLIIRPLGTVVFHCRTKESLQSMDVALRDPNPGEGPELDKREPSSLSRNDLYKLVIWYKSVIDVASDTEVSDIALKSVLQIHSDVLLLDSIGGRV